MSEFCSLHITNGWTSCGLTWDVWKTKSTKLHKTCINGIYTLPETKSSPPNPKRKPDRLPHCQHFFQVLCHVSFREGIREMPCDWREMYTGEHDITNPNKALLYGKSLKFTLHLHCLIPPKIGNWMTPVARFPQVAGTWNTVKVKMGRLSSWSQKLSSPEFF